MIKRVVTLALLSTLFMTACAQRTPLIEQLQAKYPNTAFKAVRSSTIPGVYEVSMGSNIAYTDKSGRYFIFGHLFDMQEQKNLTAERQREAQKIAFPTQALENAIKIVKGDGSRTFAVFSDPDCPYCKKLEGELARLDNVTIYLFLYPLESLHPEAKTTAMRIWCAPDKAVAWNAFMLTGKKPPLTACKNPIHDNVTLGASLGIAGTPTLIAEDGRAWPGFASAEQIEKWLNQGSAQ